MSDHDVIADFYGVHIFLNKKLARLSPDDTVDVFGQVAMIPVGVFAQDIRHQGYEVSCSVWLFYNGHGIHVIVDIAFVFATAGIADAVAFVKTARFEVNRRAVQLIGRGVADAAVGDV